MPRYRDPSTGRTISSAEPLSDADLEEAFGSATTSTPTSEPLPSGFLERAKRAGMYAFGKGRQLIQDVNELTSSISDPGASIGKYAGPALNVGGTALAPGLTLAGTAVGAAARAAGADETTADVANAATQIGGGVWQGVSAARNLPRTVKSLYTDVARGATTAPPVQLGTVVGDRLAQALDPTVTAWGGARPQEIRAAMPVLEKLTAPGSAGATYADLDQALLALRSRGMRGPIRGAIDRAAEEMLPPGLQTARKSADWWYRMSRTKPLLGGLFGGIARGGLGLGAAHEAYQGNYGRAAALALGAAGGRLSPGQLLAAAQAGGPGVAAGLNRLRETTHAGILNLANPDESGTPEGTQTPPAEPGGPSESPGPAPTAPPTIQALPGPYGREIAAAAHLVKIPPILLQQVMKQESGGNPNALSHPEPGQAQTPAHGLMQITPDTFKSVSPTVGALLGRAPQLENPLDNIIAGAVLWRKYLDQTQGDVRGAAELYFGGGGTGPRTRQYGEDIVNRYAGAAG